MQKLKMESNLCSCVGSKWSTGLELHKHKLWVNLKLVKMARRRAPKTKDIDFEEESDQDSDDEEESEQVPSLYSEAESDQQVSCGEEDDEEESDISQEAKFELTKDAKQERLGLQTTKDVCSLCGDPLNGERYHEQAAHRRCVLSHRCLMNKLKGQRKLALKSVKKDNPKEFMRILACMGGDDGGQSRRGGGGVKYKD